MPNVDWKWFIIGILVSMFIVPFVQSRLSSTLNKRTTNKV